MYALITFILINSNQEMIMSGDTHIKSLKIHYEQAGGEENFKNIGNDIKLANTSIHGRTYALIRVGKNKKDDKDEPEWIRVTVSKTDQVALATLMVLKKQLQDYTATKGNSIDSFFKGGKVTVQVTENKDGHYKFEHANKELHNHLKNMQEGIKEKYTNISKSGEKHEKYNDLGNIENIDTYFSRKVNRTKKKYSDLVTSPSTTSNNTSSKIGISSPIQSVQANPTSNGAKFSDIVPFERPIKNLKKNNFDNNKIREKIIKDKKSNELYLEVKNSLYLTKNETSKKAIVNRNLMHNGKPLNPIDKNWQKLGICDPEYRIDFYQGKEGNGTNSPVKAFYELTNFATTDIHNFENAKPIFIYKKSEDDEPKEFYSTEQFFQWAKFEGYPVTQEKILATKNPAEIYRIANSDKVNSSALPPTFNRSNWERSINLSEFKDKLYLPEDIANDINNTFNWKYKDYVMLQALRAKFNNDPWKDILLSTGDAYLIESAIKKNNKGFDDSYWGIASSAGNSKQGWPALDVGHNKLGKLLMIVRAEIQYLDHGGSQSASSSKNFS
ncbi:MAG: hypothetical protein K0S74_75 [Chlamydiales bacterium]|jgi:predicted NAD-dependent protein-ADP-ribosyltransferase YbiA (DUF1768 family)|nr:hypothetical protein [Chlamydiales bacterium]